MAQDGDSRRARDRIRAYDLLLRRQNGSMRLPGETPKCAGHQRWLRWVTQLQEGDRGSRCVPTAYRHHLDLGIATAARRLRTQRRHHSTSLPFGRERSKCPSPGAAALRHGVLQRPRAGPLSSWTRAPEALGVLSWTWLALTRLWLASVPSVLRAGRFAGAHAAPTQPVAKRS